MNYHIIPQDKFFNAYIEDIYKIGGGSNNVFLVRGEKGDTPFFSTNRPVEYLGYDVDFIEKRISLFEKEDRIIISGYDSFWGKILINSGVKSQLYVYIMGYEFFADPEGYHDEWLYDPRTRWYIRRNCRFHSVWFKLKRKWYKLPCYLYESYKFKNEIKQIYKKKLEYIERIDYLVTSKKDIAEIELIKKLYPSCHAKHVIGGFDQNVDAAKNIIVKYYYSDERSLRILLGNSADPTNNHADTVNFFTRGRLKNSSIFAPLSYGNMHYADFVEQYMIKRLGNRFHPIRDYMPREEYIKFLSSMDMAIMNHNRQQAYGNICTILTLGKPVFMKTKNVVYPLLRSMGIEDVYDVHELHKMEIKTVLSKADHNRQKNVQILLEYHSEETRLNNLRKLLCENTFTES